MADNAYDFAVLGSSAQAVILAAFLASQQKRSVVLVAEAASGFRIRRAFDLGMAPLTRPETMSLLRRSSSETVSALDAVAKGLVGRTTAHFVADLPTSRDGLMHFRQLARLSGIQADVVGDRALPAAGVLRVRDVPVIDARTLLPALAVMMAGAGVRRLDAAETAVSLKRDGSARLTHKGLAAEARQAIVVGDDAIAIYLSPEALDRSLVAVPASGQFLAPAKVPLAEPFVSYLDRGVTLISEGRAGIHAVVTGSTDTQDQRLGSILRLDAPLRRGGSAQFTSYATMDGAPYVGPVKGGRTLIIAGFGLCGAFIAPALARMICGMATTDESAWFAMRGSSRSATRALAAEFTQAAA